MPHPPLAPRRDPTPPQGDDGLSHLLEEMRGLTGLLPGVAGRPTEARSA